MRGSAQTKAGRLGATRAARGGARAPDLPADHQHAAARAIANARDAAAQHLVQRLADAALEQTREISPFPRR